MLGVGRHLNATDRLDPANLRVQDRTDRSLTPLLAPGRHPHTRSSADRHLGHAHSGRRHRGTDPADRCTRDAAGDQLLRRTPDSSPWGDRNQGSPLSATYSLSVVVCPQLERFRTGSTRRRRVARPGRLPRACAQGLPFSRSELSGNSDICGPGRQTGKAAVLKMRCLWVRIPPGLLSPFASISHAARVTAGTDIFGRPTHALLATSTNALPAMGGAMTQRIVRASRRRSPPAAFIVRFDDERGHQTGTCGPVTPSDPLSGSPEPPARRRRRSGAPAWRSSTRECRVESRRR